MDTTSRLAQQLDRHNTRKDQAAQATREQIERAAELIAYMQGSATTGNPTHEEIAEAAYLLATAATRIGREARAAARAENEAQRLEEELINR